MATIRLTDISIRALSLPAAGQYDVYDGATPGFGVRVSQGGTKSYFVAFRSKRIKRRVTLGNTKTISLKQAREAARKHLATNTLSDKTHVPLQRVTFPHALETFLSTYCAVHNRPSTAKSTEHYLKYHFLEPFRHKKLAQVTTHDITAVLDTLSPSNAAHAFAALRQLFNHARTRRLVAASPCDGLKYKHGPARSRTLTPAETVEVFYTAYQGLTATAPTRPFCFSCS